MGVDLLCNPVVAVGSAYADRSAACAAGSTTLLSAFNTTYTATTCPNLPAAQLANLGGVARAAGALVVGMPNIDKLLDCSYIEALLEDVESNCEGLTGGARGLFGGLLLCCLAFSFFVFVGVWAWRHAYVPDTGMSAVGADVEGKTLDEEAPAPAAETDAPQPVEAAS